MGKTKTEKITSIEEQIKQLENEKKRLIQQQKEADRNARTKRLCSRGGYIESRLPEIISLTEEQFKSFLDKTLFSESARKMLTELTGKTANTTAPIPAKTEQDGDNDGDE